jgi:DNA processing protein
MTLDHAVALSLVPELARSGLTERLLADDPVLLEQADRYADRARDLRARVAPRNIHVVAWNDSAFPAALRAIGDMPPALWYRGELQALAAPCVAIVGSRAASAVALESAERLAEDLAARGVLVVSGLARGVDSAAHRGALRGGRTAAVLGSGLDHIYPAEHTDLVRSIAATGTVLTEYPPDTPPLPFHFPLRNRLISGLSRAVVVIEASDKSGSLITAGCALEQGREVMAVPGNILSGRNRGGHALIRDGAKIVECADDIVNELCAMGVMDQPPRAAATRLGSMPCGDGLMAVMEAGQPYDLDGLSERSGLPPVQLLSRLFDLEMQGRVKRLDGGRFVRPS